MIREKDEKKKCDEEEAERRWRAEEEEQRKWPPFQQRWDTVRLLGRGASGEVHEVLTDKGIRCAAKTIRLPVQLGDQQGKIDRKFEKLIDGERNLCKLIHRNIVSFLWISQHDWTLVVFMEILDGVTLQDRIDGKALDEGKIASFGSQICSAMQYMHCQEPPVIHRNINCRNIMVLSEGTRVKLIDFGMSIELQESLTHYSDSDMTPKGNVYFMAPELLGADDSDSVRYSRESDIWDLGCTVYQMATGTPPYHDCHNFLSLALELDKKGAPSLPDSCSRELKNFYRECVARDRKERKSAAVLLSHEFLTAQRHEVAASGTKEADKTEIEQRMLLLIREEEEWKKREEEELRQGKEREQRMREEQKRRRREEEELMRREEEKLRRRDEDEQRSRNIADPRRREEEAERLWQEEEEKKRKILPFLHRWDVDEGTPKRLLGKGGFGEVHEVLTDKGIRCAAKTIRLPGDQQSEMGKEIIKKLVDAEQNLCKLIHRNIVSIFWISQQDSNILVLMELLHGVTLEKLIAEKKALPEDKIAGFGSQICRALHYMHSQVPPVIHRDIKCSNIIVLPDGNRIKLIDFGLSIELQEKCTHNNVTAHSNLHPNGTLCYMSPEMLGSEDLEGLTPGCYDEKTDIWSFGCTVYEMATGTQPHSACKNPGALAVKLITKGAQPLPDTCSSELKNFYKSCVVSDRKMRKSAAELLKYEFLTAQRDEGAALHAIVPLQG